MTDSDVIIIGAGVCGLMAAREASKKGRQVTLLEARSRTGGRIFTSQPHGFTSPVEEGAEFIHGELPVTASLLKEAGLSSFSMEGKTFQAEDGQLKESDEFIEGFPELISRLDDLKEDMTFRDFLDKYFPGEEYNDLRSSVISYAQGYDTSDISRVSSIALRDEWKNESEEAPERIKGGYKKLVDFLEAECRKSGCSIHLSSVVKLIRWKEGSVEVTCESGKVFRARKVLITVPLGVLQSPAESRGHIKFEPEIPEAIKALNSMGFGRVIKIFLEFKSIFWEEKIAPGLGFLLSDAEIPTWWTQLPNSVPVITGWLAGPSSEKIGQMDESEIISKALKALSYIFGKSPESLKEMLVSGRVANWNQDPFTLGAYAYTTLGTKNAVRHASEAVKGTVYFAGEAFYEGYAMGTVEAALTSGRDWANKL